MNRRELLTQTAGVAAWTAASSQRIRGANDRIGIGLIGCGGEGKGIAASANKPERGSQVVAVCDVHAGNLDEAQSKLKVSRGYRDFRKLLEDKDVDAVMIATPDHWHAIPTVLACQAGKDVYVEKPLAYDIREGRKVVEAMKRHGRIVQMGSQQRSAPHLAEAARIVQSGELGPVHFVRAWDSGNAYPDGRPMPDEAVPEGLDWDFFCGPAPLVPYNRTRFKNWLRYWDYSSGMTGGMGIHWFDTIQQVMGEPSPVRIFSAGAQYELKANREMPDIQSITYQFPTFVLNYERIDLNGRGAGDRTPGMSYYLTERADQRPHGMAFYGTNGALLADRVGFEIYPEPKSRTEYRMAARHENGPNTKPQHIRNFLDCVRSRRRPNAPVDIGHRSTILVHLGNIAYRTRLQLHWDGEKEDFVNQPEASRLLGRKARKPWNLI